MKRYGIFFSLLVFCFFFQTQAYASEWQTVIGMDNVLESPQAMVGGDKAKGLGLVVVSVPGHSPLPIGTAWLYKTDVLATNAHVAMGIASTLKTLAENKLSGVPYYLPNKTKGKFIRIIDLAVHPSYGKTPVDMNGKAPVNEPDVALLRIEEKLPSPLCVADTDTLRSLKPGDTIQYIGFPMENLAGGNVNVNNVVATTKTGTIAAMSDWWLGDSGPDANKLIRHDMGLTGGASGSPIFNKNGQVIGLVNAMNAIPIVKLKNNGEPYFERSPNASMVNFGVRADLIDAVSFK
nr:serine protease [uncultured Desulfobacter sp.]